MTKDLRLELRLSEDDAAQLVELCRAEPDLPSRGEMIRRLIRAAAAHLARPPRTRRA